VRQAGLSAGRPAGTAEPAVLLVAGPTPSTQTGPTSAASNGGRLIRSALDRPAADPRRGARSSTTPPGGAAANCWRSGSRTSSLRRARRLTTWTTPRRSVWLRRWSWRASRPGQAPPCLPERCRAAANLCARHGVQVVSQRLLGGEGQHTFTGLARALSCDGEGSRCPSSVATDADPAVRRAGFRGPFTRTWPSPAPRGGRRLRQDAARGPHGCGVADWGIPVVFLRRRDSACSAWSFPTRTRSTRRADSQHVPYTAGPPPQRSPASSRQATASSC